MGRLRSILHNILYRHTTLGRGLEMAHLGQLRFVGRRAHVHYRSHRHARWELLTPEEFKRRAASDDGEDKQQ